MTTSGKDRELALGRIYGQAIFGLAARAGQEDEVLAELEGVAALVTARPDVGSFLASPLVDDEAKRSVLERTLRGQASDLVVDALQVTRRNGRLDHLPAIAAAYRERYRAAKHQVEVSVETAVALGPQLRAELVAALARRTGGEPILIEKVNPRLLGGMVVRIGDAKIDSSVSTEIDRLEADLMARASRELLSGKAYAVNE
ncbi:MAG: ATP synthase F1 subunit delta [Thermoanaerobaculia bacterium]